MIHIVMHYYIERAQQIINRSRNNTLCNANNGVNIKINNRIGTTSNSGNGENNDSAYNDSTNNSSRENMPKASTTTSFDTDNTS